MAGLWKSQKNDFPTTPWITLRVTHITPRPTTADIIKKEENSKKKEGRRFAPFKGKKQSKNDCPLSSGIGVHYQPE